MGGADKNTQGWRPAPGGACQEPLTSKDEWTILTNGERFGAGKRKYTDTHHDVIWRRKSELHHKSQALSQRSWCCVHLLREGHISTTRTTVSQGS